MKVAVIMGSISDEKIGFDAVKKLKEFGVEYEVRVISAHRAHSILEKYCINFEKNDISVVIAIAGKAAHLPGVIASMTSCPVIGVPVKTDMMGGLDSLLSIVQMPTGVPVATVGVNAGVNAAIIAAQILALKDNKLKEKLEIHRINNVKSVNDMQLELEKKLEGEM